MEHQETGISSGLEYKQPNHTPPKDIATTEITQGWAPSHLSAAGPKGCWQSVLLAALSSYPSLNIFPVSTPPSHVDIPSQEENVSYMGQHARTEGKISVCFFMGVPFSVEVPNASVLTILNNHIVYGAPLISWPLGCLHLAIIFQYFDSYFIDGQIKVKES